ncbi:MAG: F0F1 ATP synthase subunit A [Lactobacillaceae bacterium]|nr:F0F1 ATP synthase subunit A [Lactobacillaceae bacterium]
MDEKSSTFSIGMLTFDWPVVISTLVAAILVFLLVFFLSRNLQMRPKGKQNILEWMIDFVNGIVESSLPNATGTEVKLFAFVMFLFIFVSNQLGLALQVEVGGVTFLKSATANLLVTMTLGLVAIGLGHMLGVAKLGFKGYFKNVYLTPYTLLLPINIMEQFTSFLTLSMRLFGNIMAGEMLLMLIAGFGLPGGSFGWQTVPAFFLSMIWQGFSLFIGAVQAYVFVTLMNVYISEKTIAE